MESFFKIKLLKVSRKWWSPFSILKTLRIVRKSCSPISVLKTLRVLRHWWSSFWVLEVSRAVRKWPTTQINGFTYIMLEATVPSFPSYSYSEHFWKYRRKSPCVSNDCLSLLTQGLSVFTFNWTFCAYSFS